jgi:hypothetical protein
MFEPEVKDPIVLGKGSPIVLGRDIPVTFGMGFTFAEYTLNSILVEGQILTISNHIGQR